MTECPKSVLDLIERFEHNRNDYEGAKYNETSLAHEFMDDFFRALGWDVGNKKALPERDKEVIFEQNLKTGRADYTFRLLHKELFFAEIKKPSHTLSDDDAFQLRQYGYSGSVPLSILTNFKELIVYDCRQKPKKGERAARFIRLKIGYEDYKTEKWDEIVRLFHRDEVANGSLDRFAEKEKRGALPVGATFLNDIELSRKELARNLAQRNRLDENSLKYVVQRTLDRLIFLRVAEDRNIETHDEEPLQELLEERQVYQKLCKVFERADALYNSGLFHFHREKDRAEEPTEDDLKLKIDNKVLKPIIDRLYSYKFDRISIDVLGSAYEQFLGKVIRLKRNGRDAVVENKPEVKKAGGVYYTPKYIVDYIVENTVGKLCEGKSPKEMKKLRILDPACGSGSFLVGAYTYLLDTHLHWYMKHERNSTDKIYKTQNGQWHLATKEKRQILLNNIYGVDIDRQAVEVTKLNLLLKMLEGENRQTIQKLLKGFSGRALPDLGNNIKCGNSLISGDTLELKKYFGDDYYKVNAFNWDESFGPIMKKGGFDVVIGNPPWGGDIDKITKYIEVFYPESTQSYRDTFKLFVEKGIYLTKQKGIFSFIIPSAFMFQSRYIDIRRLLRKFRILTLWNVGDKVFDARIAAPCCIFMVQKDIPKNNSNVLVLDTSHINDNKKRAEISQSPTYRKIPQLTYEKTTEETFITYFREPHKNEVRLDKILNCVDCGIKHQRVGVGMEQKGKSDLASRLYYEGKKQNAKDYKYLIGADLDINGWYVDYSNERYLRNNYKGILRENEIVYFNEDVFNLPEKIIWRQTSDRIRAAIIGKHWFANTLQAGALLNHTYNIKYVLGIINSRFLNFIYIETVKEKGRVFPQVKMGKVRALPFRTIDFGNPKEKAMHDKIVEFVDIMLDLNKKIQTAKGSEKDQLQRQIDKTDREIDDLVYKLYGLTEKEIKIIAD